MRILVVGSGGREHALCWKLAASPLADALYCAPGNAGIAQEATCVDVAADDVAGLRAFAVDNAVDIVVVGPEAPLVAGLVDALEAAGIRAFGPASAAAELEGSKGFMKDLCAGYGIPTGAYRRFAAGDVEAAKAYAGELGAPVVVKADGLAAGKGVSVCTSLAEAEAAIEDMLRGHRFGAAGDEIVVEECLRGEEASAFAIVDGEQALMLASCQDHKRAYDGDTGPNTGGMGAYSPAPVMTPEMEARVHREILQPTVEAMRAEGRPFRGVLYAGLMITDEGPKVLEFNARFGDPECQVLMARLMSDLLPALVAACDGVLHTFDLRWLAEPAICVVMAARGYPDAYAKGEVITGLDAATAEDDDVLVFHAGTGRDERGRIVSAGGRVLSVTALGKSLAEAHDRVYAAVDRIEWPGGFCRRDIARRALGGDAIESED